MRAFNTEPALSKLEC